jgi:hypothetical protein
MKVHKRPKRAKKPTDTKMLPREAAMIRMADGNRKTISLVAIMQHDMQLKRSTDELLHYVIIFVDTNENVYF